MIDVDHACSVRQCPQGSDSCQSVCDVMDQSCRQRKQRRGLRIFRATNMPGGRDPRVHSPHRHGISAHLRFEPQRHYINAAIALTGRDVDRPCDGPGRTMPGQLEFVDTLLGRGDNPFSECLMYVDTLWHRAYHPWPCWRTTSVLPSAAKSQSRSGKTPYPFVEHYRAAAQGRRKTVNYFMRPQSLSTLRARHTLYAWKSPVKYSPESTGRNSDTVRSVQLI